MRRLDDAAVRHGTPAADGEKQRFATVNIIHLLSGLDRPVAVLERAEAGGLGEADGGADGFTLGTGLVEIRDIIPAVVLERRAFGGVHHVVAVFLLVEKGFFEFVHD